MCDEDYDRKSEGPSPHRDQGEAQMPQSMCSREKAASVLRRTAQELRRKADQLARLADVADALLQGDPAEEALWEMALRARRPF